MAKTWSFQNRMKKAL